MHHQACMKAEKTCCNVDMQIVCRDGSELNFSIRASCRSPKLADLMVVSDKKARGLYSVRAYHTGPCNMNRVSPEYLITKPRFLATIVALLEIRESARWGPLWVILVGTRQCEVIMFMSDVGNLVVDKRRYRIVVVMIHRRIRFVEKSIE